MTETLTLEYKLRTFNTKSGRDKKSKCEIYLDGVSLGLVNSAIHDGARVLLKMGYSPHTLLTTRSQDSQHNSWVPKPLSHWAKSTVKERDSTGLALEPFSQFPGVPLKVPFSDLCDPTYQNRQDRPVRYVPGTVEASL